MSYKILSHSTWANNGFHFQSDLIKGKQGANEAYLLGVFGKTASEISYLSIMIMFAYVQHN
ncbi:MAG: hypothetical protein ACW98F_17715 [Candidatus Hodarchaeales archaeon]|jgi:hypothetical protein